MRYTFYTNALLSAILIHIQSRKEIKLLPLILYRMNKVK